MPQHEIMADYSAFETIYGTETPPRSFSSDLELLAENGLNPKLADIAYTPGNFLDLEGSLWLRDWYDAVADSVGTATDGSLRALVVDCSDVVAGTNVNAGGGNLGGKEIDVYDESASIYVKLRGLDFWAQMNHVADDRLTLTAYPELADVVLSFRVTYQDLGSYSFEDGASRTVYGNTLEFTALNPATGETCSGKMIVDDVIMAYAAPNTTTCWLPFPTIYIDPEIVEGTGQPPKAPEADRFMQTVLSWFPTAE